MSETDCISPQYSRYDCYPRLCYRTKLRVTALITLALPHIARLKKAKLVEDKLQKYAANLASAVLATATVVTAYAWGTTLTNAELTVVGLSTIINACIDAFVPESKVVEKLLKDIDALQSDAASNVTAESQEVVATRIAILSNVKIKIRNSHGIADDQSESTSPPVMPIAAVGPAHSSITRSRSPHPRHKAKSHSPRRREQAHNKSRAEVKTTPFRSVHVRSAVPPAVARMYK